VISAIAGTVASRAQSRCHSLMTAIQVIGTAPAAPCAERHCRAPRGYAAGCIGYEEDVIAVAGSGSPHREAASVHSAAMMSCFRPVSSTASTTRWSSHVLMKVRLIGFCVGKTSWMPLRRYPPRSR